MVAAHIVAILKLVAVRNVEPEFQEIHGFAKITKIPLLRLKLKGQNIES